MLSGIEGVLLLVARVAFGGVLALTGLNHFLDGESMAGYAEAKGLPAPRLAVAFSGGMLVFGGLAIALGVLPLLGAARSCCSCSSRRPRCTTSGRHPRSSGSRR
jgi:putative oxidoreductase